MYRKLLAVAGSVAMGAAALAGPATAAHTDSAGSGAYRQNTGGFRCVGVVHDDGDGGRMSVVVRAKETRLEDDHFRTDLVRTRIVAQERTYNGVWKDVKATGFVNGRLGATRDIGAYNVARVRWGGDNSPRLGITVAGFDDLFRIKTVSWFYSDEGARLARLVTHNGTCRV